ncbi:MAG: PPC domain-containing DNA-binding protein, partial [Thermodesulfobacteriota bacterium]|nr:PPC domain-containing DNA-binding protein [Thermodesulfobacteriota bacterium]
PKHGRMKTIEPIEHILDDVHEVTGTGTIFPDDEGNPTLHMHMTCGRKTFTTTGCIRNGVKVWHIMEVILFELTETSGIRTFESQTGLKLLNP